MAVQRDNVIASAEKLVAKGRIEPAIKEYERLLDDNPNDVNTLNRIGDLWVRINRNDEAVKTFGKIADHYSKDGFFLKAIAIYKKINKLDPSKLDVYAKLADLYAKQGLAMEAKSQYQVLADYYLKHGDPGNALVIYRKISELDPNSINVHVKLADLYSQNNQTGDALKEYDRVGRMLLKRGMLDEAVQVFRKALKIDARNIDLVESLVTALLEAKDYGNAIQIVETALESNRDHPRLVGLWSRIQLAKGDVASAKSALERALGAHPDEPLIRETLADLYLKQSNPDRAAEMLAPLSEKALSRGERGQAVEMLNRILRVDSGHTPTLERLVGVYMRLNEETNILASMNSLAEAHIAKGHYDEAAKVLERLIQREPQNAQHRNKLAFVKSQIGGIDTIPARQKTAHETPLPPMEIEEPVPTFDGGEESAPALDFGVDSGPSFELDLSPEPSAEQAPPPRLAAAVDIAASELAAEEDDDLDFITEHLTEAEVFAKYGLAEKATEHLRAVIERAPKNLSAHERLYRILLDEGDVEAGRTAATQYISLLREKGDDDAISGVVQEFLARGHSLEAGAPATKRPTMERPRPATMERLKPPTVERPLPGGIAESADAGMAAEEEITFDLDAGPSFELPALDLDADHAVSAAEPALEAEPEIETAMEGDLELTPELELTPDLELTSELSASEELPADEAEEIETLLPEAAEPEMPIESEAPLELEPMTEEEAKLDTVTPEAATEFGEAEVGESATEVQAEAPGQDLFFGAEAEMPHEPSTEELGEVDFYVAQELFDEAKARLESLLARYPANPDLELRARRIDEGIAAAKRAAAPPKKTAAAPPPAAPPAATPAAPPPAAHSAAPPAAAAHPAAPAPAARPAAPPPPARPAPPLTLSRDEIESELLSAIPDEEEEFIAPPPPPAASMAAAPLPPPFPAAQEENLFADEDDFFDLAAELESEMTEEEEPLALSEEEQSLEEIFKEFKKGVEQQLDSEDYDTHYNLGIAYKEMGLTDEAIGEFQLASKDPKRAVECASMLGLCFLEKGMPQLAIKWYRKGLEMPEISEDEHVGLLYDLGSAYMEVGDTKNAQKAFMEVYGMNTNYRDVVNRIKQLEAT